MGEETDRKKIVLMGLDNGGKTSIMLNLKGVKNVGAYNRLSPTIGINIETIDAIGSEITIFDFGGQEQYRESHLANLENHLFGTNSVIYVIDVQDSERYELALNYLKKIIKVIKELSLEVEFTIFLHKWDPDIELLKKNINLPEVEKLIQQVKEVIPSNLSYKFQKTSIYTVFEKSNI